MEGNSFEAAFARIDAALARIDAAAARPAPSDDGLATRHEKLRAAVAGSLRELDGLIEPQEK